MTRFRGYVRPGQSLLFHSPAKVTPCTSPSIVCTFGASGGMGGGTGSESQAIAASSSMARRISLRRRLSMRPGLEVLLDDVTGLRGKRVGVCCNHTAVDRSLDHILDRLAGAGVSVRRIFGPEHGVHATAQDM